jgi:hypothetical protein
MRARRPYPTDLSDDEWEILKPLIPEAKPGGRPRAHQPRALERHLLRLEGRVRLEAASSRLLALADRLDGLITNDKFCFLRRRRLKLRPRRRNYVFSFTIQRGGNNETTVDGSSHSTNPKRRHQSLGSGLPAHPALGNTSHRRTSEGGN